MGVVGNGWRGSRDDVDQRHEFSQCDGDGAMILKVARLGHPLLRRRAKAVPMALVARPEFQRFLDDLVETMHEYDGVGLAAPQVHVSLQVAVIEVQRNPRYPKAPPVPLTMVLNPRLRPASRRQVLDWEGCLSIPDLRGQVPRWRSVIVDGLDRRGRPLRLRASDFFARVLQHEWDHLQGRVYLDRMHGLSSLTHLAERARFWAKE